MNPPALALTTTGSYWDTPLATKALLAATICFGCACVAAPTEVGRSRLEDDTARFLIVFRDGRVPEDAAELVRGAGGELVRTIAGPGVGFATSADPQFAAALAGSDAVEAVDVEPQYAPAAEDPDPVTVELAGGAEALGVDGPTSADTFYAAQWNIRRVKADQAWTTSTGSPSTVVAVIDTGVATNHPDLAGRIVHSACFAQSGVCNPYPTLVSHGTWVAGIIAASFGGGAVVGVGPNLALASYNVFDDDGRPIASTEAIISAMMDAADRGYGVINMSLGARLNRTIDEDDAVWEALNRTAAYCMRQGSVVIGGAGNNAVDLNGPTELVPGSLPLVVGVSAAAVRPRPEYPQEGSFDVLAYYSNYGAAIAVAAPGGDLGPAPPGNQLAYAIRSSAVVPGAACAPQCPVGYTLNIGTSAAAPHVAGVAGLIRTVRPDLNPYQVVARLKRTAEPLGDHQSFGQGMVDAERALR